jgi:hypothetical protein
VHDFIFPGQPLLPDFLDEICLDLKENASGFVYSSPLLRSFLVFFYILLLANDNLSGRWLIY